MRVDHPLEIILGEEALAEGGRCRQVSDLVNARWPVTEGSPPGGRLVPEHLVELVTDMCERHLSDTLPVMCCREHAVAQLAAYWYLWGYQAAQLERAEAATPDVPDDPRDAT